MGMKRSRLALPRNEYVKLQQKVFARDKWRCRCCGVHSRIVAHHVVYRSHGGDDASWNLLTICTFCHDSIHKPNPRTGAMLVVLPLQEGQMIDCDKEVKFMFINGWKPQRKVA
jgi:5-methylcytosine-specific restriction endonuclease McrA